MDIKYKIFNKVPFVLITAHAAKRAKERCGLEPSDIRNAIIRNWKSAYDTVKFGIREKWIPLVGPLGQGTIVILYQSDGWTATTVRDSNTFSQSERRNSKLKYSFGDIIRESLRLEKELEEKILQ